MKDKIVLIEWEDASFNGGYYDEKEPQDFEPILNRTVGHLVKSDRSKVIVSTDRWGKEPDTHRHISTIPKKMIKSIKYLE